MFRGITVLIFTMLSQACSNGEFVFTRISNLEDTVKSLKIVKNDLTNRLKRTGVLELQQENENLKKQIEVLKTKIEKKKKNIGSMLD